MDQQRTFQHDRAFDGPAVVAPPLRRAMDRAGARRFAERCAESAGSGRGFLSNPSAEAKARALADLDLMLRGFIAKLAPGDEFQCADFTEWLHRAGVAPDPEIIDPRVVGGLIPALAREGLVVAAGYAPTRASEHTNAHSSPKRVWRVAARAIPTVQEGAPS